MADILSLCSVTYLCGLQSVLCTDKPLLNHSGKGMTSRNTYTTHSAELSSMVIQRGKARGLTVWMCLMILGTESVWVLKVCNVWIHKLIWGNFLQSPDVQNGKQGIQFSLMPENRGSFVLLKIYSVIQCIQVCILLFILWWDLHKIQLSEFLCV